MSPVWFCQKILIETVRDWNAPSLTAFYSWLASGCVSGLHLIKCGVGKVEISSIHLFLAQPQTFAKALEVDNFPFTKETDYIIDIRVIR